MSTRGVAAIATSLILVAGCQTPSQGSELGSAALPWPSQGPSSTPGRVPDLSLDVGGAHLRRATARSSAPPVPVPTESPPTPREPVPPKAAPKPTGRSVVGTASTYGDGYEGLFAMPRNLGGRGEHVRVCSIKTGRCIVRTSNDVGPVVSLHRVADLDATDFNYLCRCSWRSAGVQKVRITWLNP